MLNPVASTTKSSLLSALTSASAQTGQAGETADFEALLQGGAQAGLLTKAPDALADLKLTLSPLNLPTGNGGKGTGKILPGLDPEAGTTTFVTETSTQADETSEAAGDRLGATVEIPLAGFIVAEPILLPAPVADGTPRFDAITNDGRQGNATTTASPASTVSLRLAQQAGLVLSGGTHTESDPAAPASQIPVAKSATAVSALLPAALQGLAAADQAGTASAAPIEARISVASAETATAPAAASFIAHGSKATGAEDRKAAASSRLIAAMRSSADADGRAAVSDTRPISASAIVPADGVKPETLTSASASAVAPSPESERAKPEAGDRVIRTPRLSAEEAPAPARAASAASIAPVAQEAASATASAPVQTGVGATTPTGPAAPVSTSFSSAANLSVEQPQDIGTLVDRLVEAREAAMPHVVRAAVSHGQFGSIAMQFQSDDTRLSVTMTSADPDFAPAVQAAAAQAAASSDQSSGQSRSDAHSRQDQQQQAQQQSGASTSTGGQSQSHAEGRTGADRDSGRAGQQARTGAGQSDPDHPQSRQQSASQGGIYA